MKGFALAALAIVKVAAVDTTEGAYENGWVKYEHETVAGKTCPGCSERPPQPLTSRRRADEHEVSFTLALKEQGREEILRIATAVSDPDSPSYGQYLTQAELDEIIAPKEEDTQAVLSWLVDNGFTYHRIGVSNIAVRTTARAAASLLNTKFSVIRNNEASQEVVRAGDYELPAAIHNAVSAVFGLHGLPLPAREVTKPPPMPHRPKPPANVTPAVLYSTYGIKLGKVSRSAKNQQAVAEFQGQFMNSTDLATLFKNYVTEIDPDYEVGTDDVVSKWFGKHIENSGGIEAELDIQYMMGLSPGIQTQFWEFPGQDFCGDLNMWTSNLTSTDDCPLVHSVSYGWQGNLSQIQCKMDNVDVVDGNFAKLAAKGISIMISSGDSGSGYAPPNQCMMMPGGHLGQKGVGIDGDVLRMMKVEEVGECCEEAGQAKAAGWTFVPHPKKGPDALLTDGNTYEKPTKFEFKDAMYHDIEAGVEPGRPDPESKSPFKMRDIFILNGELDESGGDVKVHNTNGTVDDTTIHFSAPEKSEGIETIRNVTATFGDVDLKGRAVFVAMQGNPARCFNIEWVMHEGEPGREAESLWEFGPNPPPPPPPGECTIYKTVNSHTSANDSTISDFKKKTHVTLWPSWPASSPWVTAVGATRFVGQEVGNDEMATDQFGSGGGFSKQFDQTNAAWQADATAKYLSTVDPSTLPPAEAYPAKGRGTPDVAALGEGYQVVVGGHVTAVGGTSASSPAFAGMMSLINEARLSAGKPAMGFLNPFLYKNAETGFTDVTLGSNKIGRGKPPDVPCVHD